MAYTAQVLPVARPERCVFQRAPVIVVLLEVVLRRFVRVVNLWSVDRTKAWFLWTALWVGSFLGIVRRRYFSGWCD